MSMYKSIDFAGFVFLSFLGLFCPWQKRSVV